jgi:hypothetical protein
MTRDDIEQLHHQGFLSVPALTTENDIAHIRELLDALFQAGQHLDGVINHPSNFKRQLRRTQAFQICRDIARQLLGPAAWHCFDQAIYKAPYETFGSLWHQDQAYRHNAVPPGTVHFWIPLQRVTEENGCLEYVPGSHRSGLLPHQRFHEDQPDSLMMASIDSALAVSCPLPIGGATIHLPTTVHRAARNITGTIRKAWVLQFRPFGRLGFFTLPHVVGRICGMFMEPWNTGTRAVRYTKGRLPT